MTWLGAALRFDVVRFPALAPVVVAVVAGCGAGTVTIGVADGGSFGPNDGSLGGDRCVENAACVAGDHWDPTLCRCVPGDAAAEDVTAPADGSGGAPDACVAPIPCTNGYHWDSTVCSCVPDSCGCAGGVTGLGCHCGGNIANACQCQAGLVCRNDGGGPVGDVGGTCEP
jgi:hypothetical protein